MPLDANIILQGNKQVQIQNPMDIARDVMGMRQLSLQNQALEKQRTDQQSMTDILKKNTVTDEQGRTSLNNSAALSDLYKTDPSKALDFQKHIQSANLETLNFQIKSAKTLAWQLTPDNMAQTKARAIELNLPNADKIPDQYSPSFAQNWQMATLEGEAQLKNHMDEKDYGVKKDQLVISQQEANTKEKAVEVSRDHYKLMYADHQDARAQKGEDKQADYYQKASKDLESFRGNSAVQQANTALTNVSNAMSLADKGKLTPDQLHLFSSEMAKLATGGVPGSGEIEALMPNTLKTKAAKAISFFTNNPTDADAQAFIDNNKGYLKELMHNYGDVVDRYRNNTLDGYSKKITNPDYKKELQDKIIKDSYKTRFAPDPSSMAAPAAGTVRMQDPAGKIRDIPSDQIGEAIAAGGKKL